MTQPVPAVRRVRACMPPAQAGRTVSPSPPPPPISVSDPSLRLAPACARGETPFRMTAGFFRSSATDILFSKVNFVENAGVRKISRRRLHSTAGKLKALPHLSAPERLVFAICFHATPDERWELNETYQRAPIALSYYDFILASQKLPA